MTSAAEQRERIQYIYDFGALDRLPAGPRSAKLCIDRLSPRAAPSAGEPPARAVVTGDRAHVATVRYPRGSGHALKARAGEQFKYVLEGVLQVDMDGALLQVKAGEVVHIPSGMPHAIAAADGDVELVAATDTRDHEFEAGVVLPPRPAGPQTKNLTGKTVRYVYAIDELDHVPEGPSSAQVTSKNFVSGKSSSYGASLRGEALQVGLIRKARGSGAKLHTHPNEQFNLVLEGRLVGEIDGYPMEVPAGSVIHMPALVQHCTIASAEGDVRFFVVKDTSHGMAGPPVDGIEDGPRFLPGFGPGTK
jgi:quercetin dioxygenase-like cupin family protein